MDHRKIISEAVKGNPAAQKSLYDEFAPGMLGICFRYTKSFADAEDVLQDGFVKVFKYLKQYRNDGELGGWIRKIMINTALNFLKTNKRYQYDLSFEDMPLHPVSSDDPHVTMAAKELSELIRQLPTGFQTIFNLHAVEGFSHVEIASMLGISDSTSRSQYARARALLIEWVNKFSNHEQSVNYGKK